MEFKKDYPIENLKEWDKNPRKNDKAAEKLAPLIKKYGFINPIIADQNGIIRAGHTRLKSARALGMKTVPVLIVNFESEADAIGYAISDNKSQEFSDWDEELLKENFVALRKMDFDLRLTGIGEPEINRMLSEEFKELSLGNKQAKYEILMGDVYILGNHKLMCGDSTKEDMIKSLMGQERISIIFTDPPYGVSYSGTNNPNGRDWKVIEGDDLRGDELYDLIFNAFKLAQSYMNSRGSVYVFHASRNQIIFEKALNAAGFTVKQQLIWHKHHILGHSHYHWCHEPIFYCGRTNEDPIFYGDRVDKTTINKLDVDLMTEIQVKDFLKEIQKESTMWIFKKDSSKDYVHPTQKPIGIAKRAIINSSKRGEVVYDPFAGSGSTLMACEETGRLCKAMEYDPVFCSHIIERWEKFTGRMAVKYE